MGFPNFLTWNSWIGWHTIKINLPILAVKTKLLTQYSTLIKFIELEYQPDVHEITLWSSTEVLIHT